MYPYLVYVLYVGAVIGCSVLLLRRESRQRGLPAAVPGVLEAALIRGGRGAVVETAIFHLYLQRRVELKTAGTGKKLLAVFSPEKAVSISELEESVVESFMAIQGDKTAIRKARQLLSERLRETEMAMQKSGWWKSPARWRWLLAILAPCLIVGGSLRFLNYYEGVTGLVLALTVPVWAVIGRRIVAGEISGPTQKGKKLLEQLQRDTGKETDALWQMAVHGTQCLSEMPEHHRFYFMTRSIPYGYL